LAWRQAVRVISHDEHNHLNSRMVFATTASLIDTTCQKNIGGQIVPWLGTTTSSLLDGRLNLIGAITAAKRGSTKLKAPGIAWGFFSSWYECIDVRASLIDLRLVP
jgi:hypothetical protein